MSKMQGVPAILMAESVKDLINPDAYPPNIKEMLIIAFERLKSKSASEKVKEKKNSPMVYDLRYERPSLPILQGENVDRRFAISIRGWSIQEYNHADEESFLVVQRIPDSIVLKYRNTEEIVHQKFGENAVVEMVRYIFQSDLFKPNSYLLVDPEFLWALIPVANLVPPELWDKHVFVVEGVSEKRGEKHRLLDVEIIDVWGVLQR